MAIEHEVKLEPAPGFDLRALPGRLDHYAVTPPSVVRLRTLYYDTEDLRLAHAGLNLRYRWGEGWTLKLPLDRDELGATRSELRFEGEAGALPQAALELLRGVVRDASLRPVVELRTLRRQARVQGVADVADDDVSVLRAGRVVGRFRQAEVEALAGTDDRAFDDVVARLRKLGAGEPQWEPKIERALGLEPSEERVDGAVPAFALLSLALEGRFVDLLRYDVLLRLRSEVEDVHKARSSARKLRAILRGFRPFLDRAWADSLREELRWLAGEFGGVRDADVTLAALRSRAEAVPASDAPYVEATLAPLIAARDAGLRRLRGTLESERYRTLLERLAQAVRAPQLAAGATMTARELAEATLAKVSKRARKAVRRARSCATASELHHARIQVRNGRYTAEACSLVVGKPAKRLARRMTRMQDVLGAVHDAFFVQDRLRATVGDARAPLVAGELLALEAAEGEKARTAWRALRRHALRDEWSEI